MFFTTKGKLILILFISVISCSCSKHLGNISITYLDKETKEPIAGIDIDIYKDDNSGTVDFIKRLTTGNNGVCEISGIDLPGSSWTTYAVNDAGGLGDYTSVDGQYLPQRINIPYPYNQGVTCFPTPSGNIGFFAQSDFWKNKNYDTLLITSSLGLDTLIRNIDSVGHSYVTKPIDKINFEFLSRKNGITTQVYSLDQNPFLYADATFHFWYGVELSSDYIWLQF